MVQSLRSRLLLLAAIALGASGPFITTAIAHASDVNWPI